ncbi:MAG: DUF4350 domain-containing protein [Novosphingobium sp.]
MSAPISNGRDSSPFSVGGVLGLVLFGAVVFIALLWMIGAGMTGGSTNNGGGHAGGKGLNGYAALVQLLNKRGYTTSLSRSEATLDDPGLLILTPPQNAKGADIERIVAKRRYIGPTIVISPKWVAASAANATGAKPGWVALVGTAAPEWRGFLDEVSVVIEPRGKRWSTRDASGELPAPATVETGAGQGLEPLVINDSRGILAAYVQDEGNYPSLERIALNPAWEAGDDEDRYPLILVFEPDLLDNYGMARKENAVLADRLISAALGGTKGNVAFDVTLNGLGRSANLLTLAFTPPYLAATLCLLLAALAAAWRAFLRFGPALATARAIAFGKRPLVANAAGLIRRTRRLHLIARPYADHLRERIARTLGLPRHATPEATEAAIDKALALRLPGSEPFSSLAARLRSSAKPLAILRAAQALHSLERTLTR